MLGRPSAHDLCSLDESARRGVIKATPVTPTFTLRSLNHDKRENNFRNTLPPLQPTPSYSSEDATSPSPHSSGSSTSVRAARLLATNTRLHLSARASTAAVGDGTSSSLLLMLAKRRVWSALFPFPLPFPPPPIMFLVSAARSCAGIFFSRTGRNRFTSCSGPRWKQPMIGALLLEVKLGHPTGLGLPRPATVLTVLMLAWRAAAAH